MYLGCYTYDALNRSVLTSFLQRCLDRSNYQAICTELVYCIMMIGQIFNCLGEFFSILEEEPLKDWRSPRNNLEISGNPCKQNYYIYNAYFFNNDLSGNPSNPLQNPRYCRTPDKKPWPKKNPLLN